MITERWSTEELRCQPATGSSIIMVIFRAPPPWHAERPPPPPERERREAEGLQSRTRVSSPFPAATTGETGTTDQSAHRQDAGNQEEEKDFTETRQKGQRLSYGGTSTQRNDHAVAFERSREPVWVKRRPTMHTAAFTDWPTHLVSSDRRPCRRWSVCGPWSPGPAPAGPRRRTSAGEGEEQRPGNSGAAGAGPWTRRGWSFGSPGDCVAPGYRWPGTRGRRRSPLPPPRAWGRTSGGTRSAR